MKSIASLFVPVIAVAVTLFSLSGTARADALPEDACSSSATVGQTCSNAGPSFDQAGVCANETCTSTHPSGDGGFSTTTSPCVLCESTSSGDGGAITTRPDSGTTSSSSSSSSGCSASPNERDGAIGFTMLALGALGLAFGRRKRA
jgi:MYXO-CTERM domain-containing protein